MNTTAMIENHAQRQRIVIHHRAIDCVPGLHGSLSQLAIRVVSIRAETKDP
jgi:hypothetical protein